MDLLNNIGAAELLIILLLAFLVIGPERMPEFGARLGRFIRAMRETAREFIEQWEEEIGALREVADEGRGVAEALHDAVHEVQTALQSAETELAAAEETTRSQTRESDEMGRHAS